MALLVIARNSILFLFGWEIMALSAFFLVTTEDHEKEVREAGWIYLVATHTATLCLFALFALLRAASGSFALAPLDRRQPDAGHGDGDLRPGPGRVRLKAGIMPLHVWLPERPRGRAQPRLGDHVGRPHQDGHLRPGPGDVAACRTRRWPGASSSWRWAWSRASSGSPSPSASTT